MKKIILFAICLATLHASAQSFKVKTGPVVVSKELMKMFELRKFAAISLEAAIPDAHFFDLQSNRAFGMFAFAGNQYLTYENYVMPGAVKSFYAEFVDDEKGAKVRILDLINHNEKLYVVFMQLDEARDEANVYVNETSRDLLVMGSPILVHKYRSVKDDGVNVDFRISPNSKHFLLSRQIDSRRRDPISFECTIVDAGFKEVTTQPLKTSFTNRDGYVKSMRVDDNGGFSLITQNADDPDLRPMLYLYSPSSKKIISKQIGPNEGTSFATRIAVINGTDPVVIGLNKQKKEVKVFMYSIDPATGEMTQKANQIMSPEFLKYHNDGAYKASSWNVTDVVTLDNGTIMANIEATLQITSSKGGVIGYMSYNAFVLSFLPDGTIRFNTVYKIQRGGLYSQIGSKLIAYKNKAFIIYNDDEFNLKKKPNERVTTQYNGKSTMVVVQEFDADGKVAKYPLMKKTTATEDYAAQITGITKLKDNLYFVSLWRRPKLAVIEDMNMTITFE